MLYRLYFHPLARYPGPFLAKISDMYGVWHSMMGRLHIETEKGHRKYGLLSPFFSSIRNTIRFLLTGVFLSKTRLSSRPKQDCV